MVALQKLFKEFNTHLEAAKIQGFTWNQQTYEFKTPDNALDNADLQSELITDNANETIIEVSVDQTNYLVLALRYKEVFGGGSSVGGGATTPEEVPFEIDGYLTEIDTGIINADYMNSRFEKFKISRIR